MTLDLNNLPKVGEVLSFNHKGATFQVTVKNARIRYGNIDALVSPVNGTGEFWLQIQSAPKKVTQELVNA